MFDSGKLPREPGGGRRQVVVFDAVDQQHRPVRFDRSVAALIDVRIGRAGAAREVEAGQIAQHRLEIGVAAPLDLLARDDRHRGGRLGERFLRLRDRRDRRRRVAAPDGGHEPDESRRVEEVGLKVGVGREQPAERGLGLAARRPGRERSAPGAPASGCARRASASRRGTGAPPGGPRRTSPG